MDKDIVTFDTLKIELTRELIVEDAGIPDEGEYWFKKVPFTFNSHNYLLPNVVADWGKGVHIHIRGNLRFKMGLLRKLIK